LFRISSCPRPLLLFLLIILCLLLTPSAMLERYLTCYQHTHTHSNCFDRNRHVGASTKPPRSSTAGDLGKSFLPDPLVDIDAVLTAPSIQSVSYICDENGRMDIQQYFQPHCLNTLGDTNTATLAYSMLYGAPFTNSTTGLTHGLCSPLGYAFKCFKSPFTLCPADADGTQCSGHGACLDSGVCTCDCGWDGDVDCSKKSPSAAGDKHLIVHCLIRIVSQS
jgi:hypothetical protein